MFQDAEAGAEAANNLAGMHGCCAEPHTWGLTVHRQTKHCILHDAEAEAGAKAAEPGRHAWLRMCMQ